MKKQISTEGNESNINEVMQLLTELPSRLESVRRNITEEQLQTSLVAGERTPIEVLAHILHCEILDLEAKLR